LNLTQIKISKNRQVPESFTFYHLRMTNKTYWIGLLLACFTVCSSAYDPPPPTISSQELPQPLKDLWVKNLPDLGPYGHCAAAWDSRTNGEKMAFKCDMYVRLSAEGARRAMAHCREDSLKRGIKAPCQVIE